LRLGRAGQGALLVGLWAVTGGLGPAPGPPEELRAIAEHNWLVTGRG